MGKLSGIGWRSLLGWNNQGLSPSAKTARFTASSEALAIYSTPVHPAPGL